MDAVPDHRDQQQPRQQDLDRGDQRPHPRTAHGGVPDLLGGGAVAVEEKVLAADAAQHAQTGDGVGGEFGGPSGLLALLVRPPGGPGQQRQHGHRQHRQARGDDDSERRLVHEQADADQHDGDRGRGEPRQGLHEPADLLHVTRGDGHDLSGGDTAGQRRAQGRGLAPQELLYPGGRGDPIGDGGTVQEGVTDRDAGSGQRHQPPGQGEPAAGAVDRGLYGDADAEGQRGDGGEVQQAPRQRLELPGQLVSEEPPQEAGPRTRVGCPGVGKRKVLDLHDVPAARSEGGGRKREGGTGQDRAGGRTVGRRAHRRGGGASKP